MYVFMCEFVCSQLFISTMKKFNQDADSAILNRG